MSPFAAAPPAVGSEASRAPAMWPRYDTRPIDGGGKWQGRNPVQNVKSDLNFP